MTIKTFAFAAVTTGLLASPVLAVSQDMLDGIISDLSGQGYTRLEIVNSPQSVKVEAYGPNGKLERVYRADGTIAREEMENNDGSDDDDNGLRSDDYYDDDYDDDRDDDSDDDHDDDDDDNDDDDDHDDDHDEDDDEDDDNDDGDDD
jgi:hypothetical protein